MLLPMDKARALKRGPRPSELFVDAGAVIQRRRKRLFPTKNVERSSKDKLSAGWENASRSNLFLLVADPPGSDSHFSAFSKDMVGARIACRFSELIE
jgi:hypothetical protein